MTIQVGDAGSNVVFTDVVTQATTLNALNAAVTMQLRGQTTASVQLTGIGSLTVIFEVTTDNSNWTSVNAYPVAGGAPILTTTANGTWVVPIAGSFQFRARVSAFTSGSVITSVICSQGTWLPPTSTAGLPTIDLVRVAGTVLGTPTNFGTTPTAVVSISTNSSLFAGTVSVPSGTFGTAPGAVAGTLPVNASIMAATTALGVPAAFGTTPGAVIALQTNSSSFIGTVAAVAASAGVQKIGISGATGVTLDGATGAAVPANALLMAGGSVAGGTNITGITVKAASTAAAATDTSIVTQALIKNAVMSVAASGTQLVGVVGNAGATFDGVATGTAPANALYVGARAQNANPTSATNGQIVAIAADLAGRLIITPLNNRALFGWTGTTVSVNTLSTIAAAAGVSVFRDICTIAITTAGLVAQTITITDGTNSWIIDYPNAAVAPVPFVVNFGDTPLKATTANTVWSTTQSLATTCHYLVSFVDRLA